MLSTNQVSKLTGLSLRQLQHWDERGYVSPRIDRHRRLYDDREVRALTVIAALKEHGVSLNKVLWSIDGKFWQLVSMIPPKTTGWLIWMHDDERRFAYSPNLLKAAEFAVGLKGPVTIAELRTP